MTNRKTYSQQRKARRDKIGWAIIAGCALSFAAVAYGAYKIDAARGISVSQSLASVGIGKAPAAREVRLIGLCNGRILAAMEESGFPQGCAWIEPVRWAA